MAKKINKIDEATDITMRLATAKGIPEALSNLLGYGYRAADLRDALTGCEWSAEALAKIMNKHSEKMYRHNWKAVRTTPRSLIVEGIDYCNNKCTFYVVLKKNEPDMCEGIILKTDYTNRSCVPLALSNMIASGITTARFMNRLYDVADKWAAENFAAALNKAYREGDIYDRNWKAKYTRDDKCAVVGFDGFGNEHTLIIRRA